VKVSKYLVAAAAILIIVGNGTSIGYPEKLAKPGTGIQTDSVKRLAESSNDFGLRLTRALYFAKPGNNVFLSPLSIHLALDMTFMGAESATKTEMEDVLDLSELTRQEVASLANKLLETIGKAPDVNISIANSIWARKGYPFKESFLKTGEDYFGARIEELDFGSQDAVEAINSWVKDNTNGKIDRIVKQLNPLDVMVLLNAIYFEGPWKHQFDKENTKEMTFHLPANREKTIPMMSQSGTFMYLQTERAEIIRLPYGRQSRVAAYVVLPNEDCQLGPVINRLDLATWRGWMSDLKRSRGRIVLPKFKLRYESELNDPLIELGMERAFDENEADFEGIIDLPTQNAYISKVRHKTYLEVAEWGTEAAAATSVKMGLTSIGPSEDSFNMVVDRPFLFAIRHEESGGLLFAGAVMNPEKVDQ